MFFITRPTTVMGSHLYLNNKLSFHMWLLQRPNQFRFFFKQFQSIRFNFKNKKNAKIILRYPKTYMDCL